MSSAEQGNPYASLELAKMYRDGFGTCLLYTSLATPVILIATMIMCTLSGTVDHNISAVQLSFHGGYLLSLIHIWSDCWISGGFFHADGKHGG